MRHIEVSIMDDDELSIDGQTKPAGNISIREFDDGEVSALIVGITACAQGVDLSSASVAVFVELPPDAGWLRQAPLRFFC